MHATSSSETALSNPLSNLKTKILVYSALIALQNQIWN